MNSLAALVDMSQAPITISCVDAKELISAETIAVNQFLMLAEATPDEATIPTCVDFGFSLSSIQENAADLDLYRAFIVKQIALRWGTQGAAIYTVKLLGPEGRVALAFPSLAKAILDEQATKLVPPLLRLACRETETSGPVKEGGLLQQDIRLFSGKKTKQQGKEAPQMQKEQPIPKKRKVVKKNAPSRAAGMEPEVAGRVEPDLALGKLSPEASIAESTEVSGCYLQVYF